MGALLAQIDVRLAFSYNLKAGTVVEESILQIAR